VAQLGHGLGFDLSDAFSGDPVDAADFIEGARLAVGEPESQPDDAGVALGECGKYGLQLVLQQREADHVRRDDGLGVLDASGQLVVGGLSSVQLLNGTTGAVERTIPVDKTCNNGAPGFYVDQKQQTLVETGSQSVCVVDLAGKHPTKIAKVGKNCTNFLFSADPAHRRLYFWHSASSQDDQAYACAVNMDTGGVIWKAATASVTDYAVIVDTPEGVALITEENSFTESANVTVRDLATDKVLAHRRDTFGSIVSLGYSDHIGLDQAGRLYLVKLGSKAITMLNVRTWRVARTIRSPFALFGDEPIAFTANRMFVAAGGDGDRGKVGVFCQTTC